MENINLLNKIRDLGNYMLSVNVDKEREYLIKAILFNDDLQYLVFFIKMLKVEDETENQTIIENEIEVIKRSQLKEFEYIFGLDLSNLEVKNKLNEHLNELLKFKSSL